MNAGAGSFTIWQGTGWVVVIDPYTGLGAYIIAGRDHSAELEEWLHLLNATKREAAKQVVIKLNSISCGAYELSCGIGFYTGVWDCITDVRRNDRYRTNYIGDNSAYVAISTILLLCCNTSCGDLV